MVKHLVCKSQTKKRKEETTEKAKTPKAQNYLFLSFMQISIFSVCFDNKRIDQFRI